MAIPLKNRIYSSGSVFLVFALVIGWFLVKQPAEAAFVQSAFGEGTTGTTRDAVLSSNVEVGQLVVALASLEGSDLSVTFSNSGTATLSAWTEVANLDQYDAGDSNGQEAAYARVTGAGSLTVRATYGSAPSWGGIGAAVFNNMPGTLELQDSQYDSVTIQNPDGTDMTPTSQPAMVVGFAVRWGSPFETPGVDTAAGFSDGGSGAAYTGTNLMRITYQRITATTPLDLEFTTTNTGRIYLSGLIFSETPQTNNVNFFWRAEGTTLDNTHDYSVGDQTATLASTAAINTSAVRIGTNGLDIPSSSDNAQFDISNGDLISPATGSFAFWFRMVTFTGASMFSASINAQQATNITLHQTGTDDATGREIMLRNRLFGSINATLSTTDADLALNTWYFVVARYDEPNNDRRLEIYNENGSLRTAVEDLATNFDQTTGIDTLRIGENGGASIDVHLDNIFIADDYSEPLEDNMNITSWTGYGAASPPTTYRTLVASDNFNRANSTLGSPDWLQLYEFNGVVAITSNDIAGNAGATAQNSAAARWTGSGTFFKDQYSSVRISSAIAFQSNLYTIGVIVRASTDTDPSGSANRDYYGLGVAANAGSSPYLTTLYKVVDGTLTVFHSANVAWATNDRIELEVQGTTLRAMKNGIALGGSFTVTDTSLTTGNPGVAASGASGQIDGDDWEAGNLTTSAPAVEVKGNIRVKGGVNFR